MIGRLLLETLILVILIMCRAVLKLLMVLAALILVLYYLVNLTEETKKWRISAKTVLLRCGVATQVI